MDVVQVVITASATLLAVVLGSWVTVRAQDRLWRRDHARQWRDIRLAHYGEFLAAFREFVAFVQLPTTKITTVRRQREPHDLVPLFDEAGSPYREKLEAAKTAMRLVSSRPEVVRASQTMLHYARQLAAERANTAPELTPSESFDRLWEAERAFVRQARDELGLDSVFDTRV